MTLNPTRTADFFPLTPLQQGMLAVWLENPGAGRDLEQMVCTLPAGADAAALRAAWQQAADRHPALRLGFDVSGEPAQFVREPEAISWQEHDWSGQTEEDFAQWLHTDRMTGFEPAAAGLLMRFSLFRMTGGAVRLVWTFHHLLLDGRSITRLLAEVFNGAGSAESTDTFRRHCEWLASRDHEASRAFWQRYLRDVSGPTPLVIDRLAVTSSVPRQEEQRLQLDAWTTGQLEEFARTNGLTVNTLVQGAWAVLLSRYCGEETVIFGATRACRHNPSSAEQVIGPLINTVPVRADVARTASLIPWLKGLRSAWVEMREHELTPLSLVRRWCGLPADTPPFRHLLVYEHGDYTAALAEEAQPGRTFHLRELTAVPLTVSVFGGERLEMHCAYDAAEFSAEMISRMLGHFARILSAMPQRAEGTLGDLPLITPAERSALLADKAQNIAADEPRLLHEWFTTTAAAHPDRVAVNGSGESLTYRELDERSNRLAHWLIQHGAGPDVLIGICMDRTVHLVTALLGILKSGAAYLPIDLSYPADRLAFMLEDAAAPVLLTESALLSGLPEHKARVLCVDTAASELQTLPATAPQTSVQPHHMAYVIFTSGSTGRPKGCMVTHANVSRLMTSTEHWFGFGSHDVWTLFHSTAFDFSVWELWGALLYGGRLTVVPWLVTRNPEDFCRLLAEEKVTVLNQTPSAFRQLIAAEPLVRGESPALPPFSLRWIIFGGEALEMQSLKQWFDRHGDASPRLVNMYGITETTVHVTFRPLSAQDLSGGSVIGEAIPDLRVFILDPVSREPMPPGVPGEMYVSGAGLARGYLNRPELTAQRFIPDSLTGEGRLYRTGDLARWVPAGNCQGGVQFRDIEYLGRIDQQVKIRGFRIELGEIESVLCTHPLVREACVQAVAGEGGSKRLCAWIVIAPGLEPASDDLQAHLRTRLPDYMVPAAFVPMERFPITSNGKLDRRALPEPAGERTGSDYTAPSTAAERQLAEIWSAVLRLDRVGIHDNFFSIGGDSILTIQVIARAREAGLKISPKHLFAAPTIAGLARQAEQSDTAPALPLPPDDPEGPMPLTPIQQWFFGHDFANSHHWNQAFLFTLTDRPAQAALRGAVTELVRHHGALQLRFIWNRSGLEQRMPSVWEPEIFSWHDLSATPAALLAQTISEECGRSQQQLSFTSGPMIRVAVFDAGAQRESRLFIAIHHLAVDGVSWRILLEDLERLYRGILAGKPCALPAPSASWRQWTRRIPQWMQSNAGRDDAAWWGRYVPTIPAEPALPADAAETGPDTEAVCRNHEVVLSETGTQSLLKSASGQVQSVLLAALAVALHKATGRRRFAVIVEGHGREEALLCGLDVSRTAGWFTSIYPVALELPDGSLSPDRILRGVSRTLSSIPAHGAGYGVHRWCGSLPPPQTEPMIVFNYLGQFDAVLSGTSLYRFAPEPSGVWHAPAAHRAHQLEINVLVQEGKLKATFSYCPFRHRESTIAALAAAWQHALADLADAAAREAAGLPESVIPPPLLRAADTIVDAYPLSPMQGLFYSAAAVKPSGGFDQWHCRLRGPLDAALFRKAWEAVIARHSILRSTFHAEDLAEPMQAVHENVQPVWRELPGTEADIPMLLQEEAGRRPGLTQALLSRFTLLHIAPEDHWFLWSVPDLQMDGWSWPVVFGEVTACYQAFCQGREPDLSPAQPYRLFVDYVLACDHAEEETFWRQEMNGLTRATPVPVETLVKSSARRIREYSLRLDPVEVARIQAFARSRSLTPGVLLQSAWALLLAHCAAAEEVTVGTAFSGRPPELPGVAGIVGPFVNNLPLRIAAPPQMEVTDFLRSVQQRVFAVSAHQFTPISRVQDLSGIPWCSRIFDSLIVFQNYQVDDDLTRLGPGTHLTDFTGPIHTAYALTLVVTPGESWQCNLLVREGAVSDARAAAILQDLRALLLRLEQDPHQSVAAVQAAAALPRGVSLQVNAMPARSAPVIAPRTALEQQIASVWQKAFGRSDLSVDDNFFDLGGQSLLMLRVHAALTDALQRPDISIVQMFQHPTIAGLAASLAAPVAASSLKESAASRAAAARAAAARSRLVRIR